MSVSVNQPSTLVRPERKKIAAMPSRWTSSSRSSGSALLGDAGEEGEGAAARAAATVVRSADERGHGSVPFEAGRPARAPLLTRVAKGRGDVGLGVSGGGRGGGLAGGLAEPAGRTSMRCVGARRSAWTWTAAVRAGDERAFGAPFRRERLEIRLPGARARWSSPACVSQAKRAAGWSGRRRPGQRSAPSRARSAQLERRARRRRSCASRAQPLDRGDVGKIGQLARSRLRGEEGRRSRRHSRAAPDRVGGWARTKAKRGSSNRRRRR